MGTPPNAGDRARTNVGSCIFGWLVICWSSSRKMETGFSLDNARKHKVKGFQRLGEP